MSPGLTALSRCQGETSKEDKLSGIVEKKSRLPSNIVDLTFSQRQLSASATSLSRYLQATMQRRGGTGVLAAAVMQLKLEYCCDQPHTHTTQRLHNNQANQQPASTYLGREVGLNDSQLAGCCNTPIVQEPALSAAYCTGTPS
jgi:hypothetical protein